MSVAVVLYSYHKRIEHQRRIASVSCRRLGDVPGIDLYVTGRAGYDDGEPECFEKIPLDVPEGYEFLPDKTIATLRWLDTHRDFDHVIKVDDDVYLDPAALRKAIGVGGWPDYSGPYVARLGEGSNHHRGRCLTAELNAVDADTRYAGWGLRFLTGSCYILSRRAVRAVLAEVTGSGFDFDAARRSRDVRAIGAEDILVASMLRQRGIDPQESVRLIHAGCRRDLVTGIATESAGRARRLASPLPCIGVHFRNRMPRGLERLALSSWFGLSSLLPAAR